MRANDGSRTAAEVLIDQLVIHGARHVFCVPGESYIAALDAMVDRPLEVTVCRQEGGACIMAEAAGKLTGRPGICFVTRGPGATNASSGLHIAQRIPPADPVRRQIARGIASARRWGSTIVPSSARSPNG
jgi:acetolactate synthase-1/2/3 large subunit